MADKSSQAIKEFLGEAEEILENLNADLMELSQSADSGDANPDLLNSIFRGAHSLKGLSGMFGFSDIAELSHQMENALDHLRLGKIPFDELLIETLFDAFETLGKLVYGKGEDEQFTLDVSGLVNRLDALVKGEGGASEKDPFAGLEIDRSILDVLTEYEEHRLLENIKKGRNLFRVHASFALTSFDTDLAAITDALKEDGEIVSTLPSPDCEIEDGIAFQILVGTPLAEKDVKTLLDGKNAAVEAVGRKSSATQDKVPEATPKKEQSEAEAQQETVARGERSEDAGGAGMRSISRMVRVDIDKLDVLMNIVGELVIAKGTITEIAETLRIEGHGLGSDLNKATRVLERRLSELQKGVMEVRMVPVRQLFDKTARVVRKAAHDMSKKIDLQIRGADTELDKLIIEDLSDPLVHIIRNSVDHGIETPEERVAAGKPETGTLRLSAAQKGNHVVIEIRDDGRGIDPEKIRRKALERGLIDERTELSREEVYDLLFIPGFSTADKVSEISGRGVGMDVVKSNISALSGMIDIDSRVGEGTTLTITLPITLAIIKALIIRVLDNEFAIPITSVMETLMVEPASLRTIEGREVMELRQSTLPLVRLSRLFNFSSSREANPDNFFVVVVGMAEKRLGLVVDELLGQQDVVIKPLGNILSFVKGFAGAAEMGNRKTILVLDVGGLMSESLRGDLTSHV
ncbi:chemotaxis protein CheA [Geoalkalibacter subterraneus]|uniref:histidine kinase n=1 Tax=Geoalkalibacter subterraneus TaxID=483547 RepID=A0A0B5FS58_9BACT|nr:chemotaxis protein CheA [Geoalkalibacter subterraneus]AJF06426.1 chemotaxis protein CheA [Geoalkalibacter subterraneus]